MSSPPTTRDGPRSARGVASNPERGSLERVVPSLAKPIRVTSFWTAIALPFLHVPLLATGLSDPNETLVFLCLLALNLVALYVGRFHRR